MRWSFWRTARTSRPRRPRLRSRRVAVVGDVLQLAQHEARHDQRAAQEARGDDVGDATVDDGAGVDVGDRLGRLGAGARRRWPRRSTPSASSGLEQVVPLGDGQAHHAQRRGRPRRRWAGSQPYGAGRLDSGRPSRRPMSRPTSRPSDGGHELAGRQVADAAHEPARRHDRDVGQDREADHAPGDDPGDQQQAAVRRGRRRARRSDRLQPTTWIARMTPSAPPSSRTKLVMRPRSLAHRRAVATSRASVTAAGCMTGCQRLAAARHDLERLAKRADADDLEPTPVDRAVRRRRRHDGAPEAEARRLAQAPVEAGAPAAARRAGRPRRRRRVAGVDRPIAQRRGERQGQRQVEGRLLDARARRPGWRRRRGRRGRCPHGGRARR